MDKGPGPSSLVTPTGVSPAVQTYQQISYNNTIHPRREEDINQNENTEIRLQKSQLERKLKRVKLSNLGRIPNILLYLGFAGLAVFYAVSVTVAAPVLFAGGIVLATVFALSAGAELWKFFTDGSKRDSKFNWWRPNFLESVSSGVIGAGLLTLGILMLINPAFLGALLGVSLAVKIGLVAAGAVFLAKGILNYFSQKMNRDENTKLKPFLDNLPDTILYGAGLALGIMALIMNGAFALAPVVFVAVFACHMIGSFLRMLTDNPSERLAEIARGLEVASLFLIAGLLLVAGIAFAPTIASALGVSALFVKIAGCVAGCLFALAAAAKIWVGAVIEEFDLGISNGESRSGAALAIGKTRGEFRNIFLNRESMSSITSKQEEEIEDNEK